jgi:hypothetical protein
VAVPEGRAVGDTFEIHVSVHGADAPAGGAAWARSHCRCAPPTHPLHTTLTHICGVSISEATM